MAETIEPIPGWAGFYPPRYTAIPDDLFDVVMPHLTDVELRVLLYIMRRTFGFKKDADDISLSQIADGIVKADGERLDYGAGVSRRGAQEAISRLEARGVILVKRNAGANGSKLSSTYSLRMGATPGAPNALPYSTPRPTPIAPAAHTLAHQMPIQETAVQDTEKQEDTPARVDPLTLPIEQQAQWVEQEARRAQWGKPRR